MKVGVTSRSFSKNKFLRNELLKRYPNSKFNDEGKSLKGEKLINFLCDCDKAIIALETLDKEALTKLPKLKVIGKYGVGLDKLDLKLMSQLNIKIGWTPGVNARGVSELTLGFMISALRKLRLCQSQILSENFRQIQGENLSNKVVGIVGCGNVGKDLVEILKPFNCKILVNDIIEYNEFYKKHKLIKCDFKNILKSSDIITLHTPLTSKTINLIGKNEISMMKDNAILINTARGRLIDENALLNGLLSGKLASAALDVFFEEPPLNKNLLNHNNLIMSPHIGGSTQESILAMGLSAIDGLDSFQDPIDLLKFQ